MPEQTALPPVADTPEEYRPDYVRPRRWPWVLGAVVVAVLIILGWFGYTAYRASQQAKDLQTQIDQTQSDARALDLEALATDVVTMRETAAGLRSSTGGPLWWLAEKVPVIGTQVGAARSLATAADTIGQAAAGAETVLPSLRPEALRGPDGALNLQALAQVTPILQRVAAATDTAAADLDGLDPAGLQSDLAAAVRKGKELLPGLGATLRTAGDATALMPGLLGDTTPRHWLVLLQNTAEARGTGGLVGAYALLTADKGKLTLQTAAPNNALTSDRIPLDGMPEEFRELWGADASEWLSLNLSAHFPYTAQLAVKGMADRGVPIDGVLALDSQAVAALIAGTGPVSARGTTVDATNAAAFFTKDIYSRFPDVATKDAVTVALLQATFDKLLSGKLDLPAFVKALGPAGEQGRILAWSANPAEQSELATYRVGGVLPDAPGPFLATALNNGGGNKMDAYVTASLAYGAGRCEATEQVSTASLTLADKAPTGLPAYVDVRSDRKGVTGTGSTVVLASVYGPVGAEVQAATLDGAVVPVRTGLERGHPVWRVDVELNRGQSRQLVFTFTEPTVADAAPVVVAQPMANPVEVKVVDGPPCDATAPPGATPDIVVP
ncbi:MAG: DUF4012 domain-containing protein [Actinomycetota bacterium]|nr:MAG: DUF4012 domain-containing protein [Actinomycetota bacterium]